MKLTLPALMALILFIAVSGVAHAAPLKTHVTDFTIVGAPDSEVLKGTLQGILTSRLNPSLVQLVEKSDQAEILISGSYALFGNTFSLDALIKDRGNGSLNKVFEQGAGQEDVIPALGRLAKKIDAELAKKPAAAAPAMPAPLPLAPSPVPVPSHVKEQYAIPAESSAKGPSYNWSSAPLDGEFVSIATGSCGRRSRRCRPARPPPAGARPDTRAAVRPARPPALVPRRCAPRGGARRSGCRALLRGRKAGGRSVRTSDPNTLERQRARRMTCHPLPTPPSTVLSSTTTSSKNTSLR